MDSAGFVQLPPGHPRPPPGAAVPHGNQRPPPPPPPPPRPQMPTAPMPRPPAQYAMQRPIAPMMVPQHMPQTMPVPPPNEVIPPELRHKRLVERSDLRSERMTEADAREALSEYVVYRFEKVNDPNEIDDEGYPVKPTWENVTRTEVRDLSKPAITRAIRQLDDEGKTVMEKKLSLTATQQRQIEKAQNDLTMRNRDRQFCYTLQQISTKTRKLSKNSTEYRQYMAGRESKKVVVSKTKKSKKNLLETTALTVYFKREPCPGENSIGILKERQKEAEHVRRLEDQQRQNQQAQQLMAEQQRHIMMVRQQQEEFKRHMMPAPMQHPHPHPHPPHAQPPVTKGPRIPVIENDPRRGGKLKFYTVSSTGSRSSRSSCSSNSLSDTEITPESSVTGSSNSGRHGRRRHRSRSHSRGRNRSRSNSHGRRRYHDRPEDYGLPSRHHTKCDQHYILGSDAHRGGLVSVPLPLAPLPMPGGVDGLEGDVFRPRRIAERAHDDGLEDLELLSGLNLRRRGTLQPRVVHRQPSFRIVNPEEVVRQRHEGDLSNLRRLKVRDEARFEADEEYIAEMREVEDRNRRHLRTRFRRSSLERGNPFRHGSEEMFEEREARDYTGRQQRETRPPLENPLEPLGRAARRDSFARARYH